MTSAHQTELLKKGYEKFLCFGDVYRRDEIDRTHYPVFHQMEGVQRFLRDEEKNVEFVSNHLKKTLEGLAFHVFGRNIQIRWSDSYFPFTEPSYEMEIFFQNKWLEVEFIFAILTPTRS